MNNKVSPPWPQLILLAWMIGGIAFSIAFRVWFAVAMGAFFLLFLMSTQPLRNWTVSILRGSRGATSEEAGPALSFSKAQQSAVVGFVLLSLLIWRIVEAGWLAAALGGPGFVAYVGWVVLVIRREGWSGEKPRTEAGTD